MINSDVDEAFYVQDELKKIQLTILTDRSQGGASIHDGQLELMASISGCSLTTCDHRITASYSESRKTPFLSTFRARAPESDYPNIIN